MQNMGTMIDSRSIPSFPMVICSLFNERIDIFVHSPVQRSRIMQRLICRKDCFGQFKPECGASIHSIIHAVGGHFILPNVF